MLWPEKTCSDSGKESFKERGGFWCRLWSAGSARDASRSNGICFTFLLLLLLTARLVSLAVPCRSPLLSLSLWPQVIGWTSIPAPGAAPVAGLPPAARPSRPNPLWICTSTPPPAPASSSPCPWRRPWRDWRGGCLRGSKYRRRGSLCCIKKREWNRFLFSFVKRGWNVAL